MGKTRLSKKIRDTKRTFHAMTKTVPKKNKCKEAKWLSEKPLQIAEKRRKPKGIGEKEIYTHLNAEFQRRARRYMIDFLTDNAKK